MLNPDYERRLNTIVYTSFCCLGQSVSCKTDIVKNSNSPASIVVCQFAGIIGSIFTASTVSSWYPTLIKPNFSPPSLVVWPCMGFTIFSNGHIFVINMCRIKRKITKDN